jgi:transposase, IS6 family
MMRERDLSLDHTTIYRWVQAYALELEKRIRPHLRLTNDSYRVDETYIKVKGAWKYLYRAVDSTGQTIDFMLSAKRDARAAKRFFRKMLKAPNWSNGQTEGHVNRLKYIKRQMFGRAKFDLLKARVLNPI